MSFWSRIFGPSWSLPIPCGYWAYVAASVAQDNGLEATVCTGPHIKTGRSHAQAQAILDGNLEWIGVEGRRVVKAKGELVRIIRRDTPSVFLYSWTRPGP